MSTEPNAADRTIYFVGGPANGKIHHVSWTIGPSINVQIQSSRQIDCLDQVSYVNSGLITNQGAEVWVVGQQRRIGGGPQQVCEAIAETEHMTTVDAANILHALRLRQARTPLQQQGRADVDNALGACYVELIGIWAKDQQ